MPRREFEVVVAAAPREKLMATSIGQPVNIAPATESFIYIYSAPGTIGRLQSIFISMSAPAGATSGDYTVKIGSTSFAGAFMSGKTTFNKNTVFNMFTFEVGGDLTLEPAELTARVMALKDIMFDNVTGLYLLVTNNTNVAMVGDVSMRVNWIQREVS